MKTAAPVPGDALLFLTGWPACGLADFGAWLAEHRGFRHLDLDGEGGRDQELREAWAALMPDSAPRLLRDLQRHARRWVVTGERPADHLPYLGALHSAGVALWFLQPQMSSHSRQHWLAYERQLHGEARPAAWDKLADAIRRNARALRPHFRNRCIDALAAEGPIAFEVLAAAMQIPVPSREPVTNFTEGRLMGGEDSPNPPRGPNARLDALGSEAVQAADTTARAANRAKRTLSARAASQAHSPF